MNNMPKPKGTVKRIFPTISLKIMLGWSENRPPKWKGMRLIRENTCAIDFLQMGFSKMERMGIGKMVKPIRITRYIQNMEKHSK